VYDILFILYFLFRHRPDLIGYFFFFPRNAHLTPEVQPPSFFCLSCSSDRGPASCFLDEPRSTMVVQNRPLFFCLVAVCEVNLSYVTISFELVPIGVYPAYYRVFWARKTSCDRFLFLRPRFDLPPFFSSLRIFFRRVCGVPPSSLSVSGFPQVCSDGPCCSSL